MGMGKTEAALYAAYAMLVSGRARGLYFALPTQLTSTMIFARLRPFLEKILAPESRDAAAMLLHSMAWLHASHDEEGENVFSWFARSRRGLLAPFGTGTLDQALMSVIRVRHAAVRSFGLAGKVVVLDEIHSYDAYTGTLLDPLVKHLRDMDCTVILLSATLTRPRLAQITGGRAGGEAYPLVTAIPGREGGSAEELPVPDSGIISAEVTLRIGVGEGSAVSEALQRAERGEQILWIENSVREAQERYRIIAAYGAGRGLGTGLLHSCFTASDRQENEGRWTVLFGKGSDERRLCGRILVGTQVLEQSLDLDADFLVMRICPTDMLFQRLGRLWRHRDTVRPTGALRQAWILAPSLTDALGSPREAFGVTGRVYDPYILARTLEVWTGRRSVSIPGDIRPMLEETYAGRGEEPSPGMAQARQDLERKRNSLQTLALSSQSEGRQWSDGAAATRIMTRTSWAVLLVRGLEERRCVLADGQEVCLNRDQDRRRAVSAALFANIVHIRSRPFPVSVNDTPEMRRIFRYYLPVKQNCEPIFLARICPDGRLEDLCSQGRSCGRYSPRMGWEKE